MDERPTPDSTRQVGVPALPITLADGQAWGLALPSPRLRPKVERGVDALGRPTEDVRVAAELGHPIEIRLLVADLRSACEGDREERRYEALVRLAISLIRRAHDVDLTTAASLLELDVDDLPGLVDAVLSAATGVGLGVPDSPRTEIADV